MLALPTVLEIDRLLREGTLSQRQIAEQLGVSRGSVAAIASGCRALFGRLPSRKSVSTMRRYRSLPERCPECGHRVYVPCLICLARSYQAMRKLRAPESLMFFKLERPKVQARHRGRTLGSKTAANSTVPTASSNPYARRARLFSKRMAD